VTFLAKRPLDEAKLALLTSASDILALLEATKGESVIALTRLPDPVRNPDFLSALEESEIFRHLDDQQVEIPTASKAQLAIRAIELGQPQRRILSTLSWREFEAFIATVFHRHEFAVTHGLRFKAKRRFEIDVIARRNPIVFCVDCKQYGVRAGKASPLRTAVEAQLQRVEALAATFATQQAKLQCLDWHTVRFYPLLVTMLHEDILWHQEIPVVPAAQLNRFLLAFPEYSDRLHVVHPTTTRQQRL
jgi:Holliday junction resolvase-like predicted endonuclease